MTLKRIKMLKLRELLRLKFQANLSYREIGRALAISPSTVSYYLNAVQAANIQWPDEAKLSDTQLLKRIEQYAKHLKKPSKDRQEPDWAMIHSCLIPKRVTLALLWEEYTALLPKNPYSYTQFTRRYHNWCKHNQVTMRLTHVAGDKSFIDYAGDTLPIYLKQTGEILLNAQLFVMVLGLSDYTFAYLTASQSLPDWIDAHVRAFDFFGGVTRLLVPDNLKAGITDSGQFEPLENPTYADMAKHYGSAIVPARPATPQDKSKAENGVLLAQRWIMTKLLKQRFYSLSSANEALRELLYVLNHKPFQKRQGSRYSQFIEKEKPLLKPLPKTAYSFAQFKFIRVPNDYHIRIDKHYYSVPYTLISEEICCRYTQSTVEVLHNNQRICSHARSFEPDTKTTDKAHMPIAHFKYDQWTPQVFLDWAEMSGDHVYKLAQRIIAKKIHPELSSKFHFGLKRLSKSYGKNRLNCACQRALLRECTSFKSIESILKNGLDKLPLLSLVKPDRQSVTLKHDNLRGSEYYHINKIDKE